jgi:transketolase
MQDIVTKLDWARNHNHTGAPVALICHTHKGRGVSFMEDAVGWHGKPPNREELNQALEELGLSETFDVDGLLAYGASYQEEMEKRITADMPAYKRDYWWNTGDHLKVTMQPTRKGFGRALDRYGDDERIVCIGADISDSICISDFYKNHPERRERFISVGVAEQNATTIAAGLAKEGKIPVFGTYGVFASARNLDQLRVSVCYGDFNVLIAGAHGGISVGPDGATHQELESIFQIAGLPNMHMGAPCDIIETEKMTRAMLFDVIGPKYLRFAREATPIITDEDTPFQFGIGNVIRIRRKAENLLDAIEIKLASEYENEGEVLSIISCGPETAEAVRAAYILKEEFDIETRVLHLHTLKPLDRVAVVRAGQETGAMITAEEHQVGGMGNQIAGILATESAVGPGALPFAMIGVEDRFGESGKPWQLIKKFGLTAEHIAQEAKELLNL